MDLAEQMRGSVFDKPEGGNILKCLRNYPVSLSSAHPTCVLVPDSPGHSLTQFTRVCGARASTGFLGDVVRDRWMLGTVAGSFFNPPVQEMTAAQTVAPGNPGPLFWGPSSAFLLLDRA